MTLALTFDDISIIPWHSEVLPSETCVRAPLTRNITLNTPLLSAAMDTVTESAMAIAMAQEGGIGIIHKNLSVRDQVEQVRRVKGYEGGVVANPVTISPDSTIADAKRLIQSTGVSSFPVIYDACSEFVGMLTSRDIKFTRCDDVFVKDVMTPRSKIYMADESMSREEMIELMYQKKVERLPVVRRNGNTPLLVGLITLKDCQLLQQYPLSSRDKTGKLLVGAATGVGDLGFERAEALIEAGTDVIVVDTAHGHNQAVIDMVYRLKKAYPKVELIAGNIVTSSAAYQLIGAGADAVKVGIGPGSICTTRVIAGVGVPQFTALQTVAETCSVPIICDGGIRYSGDIVKAIVAGADTVMIGGLFAGTAEAPGDTEQYQGRSYKSYRGMGSIGAMSQRNGSSDRYFQEGRDTTKLVPEGIEGRVPYRGPVSGVVTQLIGGLRSGMGYVGARDFDELYCRAEWVQVTQAGQVESHPHNISIVKESPNYTGLL